MQASHLTSGHPSCSLGDREKQKDERRGESFDGLLSFLIQVSLARALIKHQNFKDAYRVLVGDLDRLHSTSNLGPLHQVIFLRTFARLYSAQQARGPEWEYLVHEAVRIASEAGLEHQSDELRREFGVGPDPHPTLS